MVTTDTLEADATLPYHPVLLSTHSEALAGNGIKANGDFQVTATATDLEIQVVAGTWISGGTETSLGSATTKTLSGGGTDDRWDTIAWDTGTSSVTVKQGTEGTAPVAPDVSGDEVLLAVVYVASGATDVADSDIYNWRPRAQRAGDTAYDDTAWSPSAATVKAALNELQEAAQIGAYPLAQADLASGSVGSGELIDGSVANADLANSSLTVTAGTALSGGGSVSLGGSTTLDVAGVTSSEITDGTLVDADIASSTTIARSKLAVAKISASKTSNYTTSGEEVIYVDSSGGVVTITLASSDAAAGRSILVVDEAGSAGTNAITIDTEGSETIEGSSSTSISTNFGTATLESNGTNWVVSASTPSSGGSSYTDEDAQDAVGNNYDSTLTYDDATPSFGVASSGITTTELDLSIAPTWTGTHTFSASSVALDIGDQAADPSANGELTRNGTDVKIHSGGSVRNLSNVGSGSYDRQTDFDHSGSKNSLSNGDQAIVGITNLDSSETLEIRQAALLKPDGQASSSSVDLKIVTLDNAGGKTDQTTLVAGDGSTVSDDVEGSPVGSFSPGSNDTTVAVLVDNQSGSAEDVYGEAKGEIV